MAQVMQANPFQANLNARTALLATGVRQRKNLGTFTGAVGGSTRVKLFNAGVLTSIKLDVTLPINTIGTATAVPGRQAPYNVIDRIRLTDYDGTDRVNMSGFQAYILDSVRYRIPYGINNEGPLLGASNTPPQLGGAVLSPSTPTAVSGSVQNLRFYLEVPVAYDPESDLRGAILAQTAVGEMFVTIDWASLATLFNATGNDTNVYSGAGTTTMTFGTPTVTVFQEYLMPQSLANGQIPLPLIDLQTVYEIQGNIRTSDNLAANQEKLINFPNVRTVIGAYVNFVQNGQLRATDVSQFRLIANGNNILREFSQYAQFIEQRNYLEGDLALGAYFWVFRQRPIETQLYGNVQMGITPNAVSGVSFMDYAFESFYTKGATLPGVGQV
jgi:hypothetical protein